MYTEDKITDNWQDTRSEIEKVLNDETESKEARNGFILHCLETLITHCKRVNFENRLLNMENSRIRDENSELKMELRKMA